MCVLKKGSRFERCPKNHKAIHWNLYSIVTHANSLKDGSARALCFPLFFQIIITHDKQGLVYPIYLFVASYSSHCIWFEVKMKSFYKNSFLQCKLLQPKALSHLSSLLM